MANPAHVGPVWVKESMADGKRECVAERSDAAMISVTVRQVSSGVESDVVVELDEDDYEIDNSDNRNNLHIIRDGSIVATFREWLSVKKEFDAEA